MKVLLNFSLDARRTAISLAVVMLLLLAAHLLAMQANFNEALGWKERLDFEYWHVAMFDLDEEESFGTWFSAMLLLFAAILFFHQAGLCRARSNRMHYWWCVLGLGFCLMSVDEVAGLHEMINTLYEETLWQNLSLAIVAATGLVFTPFLWHYRWRISVLFVVAAVLFACGAIGMEQYSGTDINSLRYNMLTAVEEGLEMCGVILAIYTVLELMAGAGEAAPQSPDAG